MKTVRTVITLQVTDEHYDENLKSILDDPKELEETQKQFKEDTESEEDGVLFAKIEFVVWFANSAGAEYLSVGNWLSAGTFVL